MSSWRTLGRCLGIREKTIEDIVKAGGLRWERAYEMLLLWKQREGFKATYQVLHDALMHPSVNRQDIAVKLRY